MSSDSDVKDATEAAEKAAQAAEQAAQAAEAVAVLEVMEEAREAADDAGDRGRVYDDQEQLAAQVAAGNAAVAGLDLRLLRVEAILRTQGYKV